MRKILLTLACASLLAFPGAALAKEAYIVGTSGPDRLQGDEQSNTIEGLPGADELRGYKGADDLNGSAGADLLYGGRGADVLYGGSSGDYLVGGRGNDILNAADGERDHIYAGEGFDKVYADNEDLVRDAEYVRR